MATLLSTPGQDSGPKPVLALDSWSTFVDDSSAASIADRHLLAQLSGPGPPKWNGKASLPSRTTSYERSLLGGGAADVGGTDRRKVNVGGRLHSIGERGADIQLRQPLRGLHDYRAGVYMQTLFRDSAAGLMHSISTGMIV